jgi:hypothetical protein
MSRKLYDALGRVAAHALADEDLVVNTIQATDENGNDQRGFRIQRGESTIELFGYASQAYLTASIPYQFSDLVVRHLDPTDIEQYAEDNALSREQAHADLVEMRVRKLQEPPEDDEDAEQYESPIDVVKAVAQEVQSHVYPVWFDTERQELFNGFAVQRRLYVYEDDFSLRVYANTMDRLKHDTGHVVANLSDALNVELLREGQPVEEVEASGPTRSYYQ